MTAQTLRSVTLATIENYHTAATLAARAYRQGGKRLIGAVNASLEKSVDPQAVKVAPQIADAMIKARGRVSEIAVKGIDVVSSRTEQAMDAGYDGVARQVTRFARFAGEIENPMVASTLETAARVSLPPARLALAVSGKVADGAKALSTAARGTPAQAVRRAVAAGKPKAARARREAVAVSRKAAKTARAGAVRTKKAATRAVRKAA